MDRILINYISIFLSGIIVGIYFRRYLFTYLDKWRVKLGGGDLSEYSRKYHSCSSK